MEAFQSCSSFVSLLALLIHQLGLQKQPALAGPSLELKGNIAVTLQFKLFRCFRRIGSEGFKGLPTRVEDLGVGTRYETGKQ